MSADFTSSEWQKVQLIYSILLKGNLTWVKQMMKFLLKSMTIGPFYSGVKLINVQRRRYCSSIAPYFLSDIMLFSER